MHIEFDSVRRSAAHVAVACILALLAVVLFPGGRSFAGENEKAKTLYQRIGGYDTVAQIVDDLLTQLHDDKAFDRFGGGRSESSLNRTRQLLADQFCALSGGPCIYIGRDMKAAHHGLKITAAEWDSTIKKLELSLDKFKVSGKDKEEFVALIQDVRNDIVEAPEEKPKEEKAAAQN
ncbi:MAG TPA: group 1 truncated hemoglobin [Terriglobales bacterium]|nr:group 1 truncated hemoglobin [Terriglobales bacterium]